MHRDKAFQAQTYTGRHGSITGPTEAIDPQISVVRLSSRSCTGHKPSPLACCFAGNGEYLQRLQWSCSGAADRGRAAAQTALEARHIGGAHSYAPTHARTRATHVHARAHAILLPLRRVSGAPSFFDRAAELRASATQRWHRWLATARLGPHARQHCSSGACKLGIEHERRGMLASSRAVAVPCIAKARRARVPLRACLGLRIEGRRQHG